MDITVEDFSLDLAIGQLNDDQKMLSQLQYTDAYADKYVDICAVDDNGASALVRAAKEGDEKKVKELIAGGAYLNQANYQFEYPLFEALKKKHEDIVIALIQNGVNLLLKDQEGYTAAMLAVRFNLKRVLELLINEYPYTLSAICPKGKNLFNLAEEANHNEIAILLRKRFPILFKRRANSLPNRV